jgi:hypothetical protein
MNPSDEILKILSESRAVEERATKSMTETPEQRRQRIAEKYFPLTIFHAEHREKTLQALAESDAALEAENAQLRKLLTDQEESLMAISSTVTDNNRLQNEVARLREVEKERDELANILNSIPST